MSAVPSIEHRLRLTAAVAVTMQRVGLTERQQQVAWQYLVGRTRQEIADTLYLSELTVANHISHIYRAFGLTGGTGVSHVRLVRRLLGFDHEEAA